MFNKAAAQGEVPYSLLKMRLMLIDEGKSKLERETSLCERLSNHALRARLK